MESLNNPVGALFAAQAGDAIVVSKNRARKGKDAEESEALGQASLQEGDVEDAIRHFRNAVTQRSGDDPKARLDLAAALLLMDEAPGAMRQYALALRVKVEAEPHLGLSEVYKRYGRYRDAIKELEEACRLEPENPFHHYKLAETLRNLGERKRALISARLATVYAPQDSFYHYWTAELLMELELWDEALESMRAAIELSPGDDYLYLRAAVPFWQVNRKLDAIRSVRLASELDPDKHLYHAVLGVLLEQNGQLEEAALEADRAAKIDEYDEDRLLRFERELGIE